MYELFIYGDTQHTQQITYSTHSTSQTHFAKFAENIITLYLGHKLHFLYTLLIYQQPIFHEHSFI